MLPMCVLLNILFCQHMRTSYRIARSANTQCTACTNIHVHAVGAHGDTSEATHMDVPAGFFFGISTPELSSDVVVTCHVCMPESTNQHNTVDQQNVMVTGR